VENQKISKKRYETEEDKLKSLKEKLITAEENNRFNDKAGAIEGYYELAKMFYNEYEDF